MVTESRTELPGDRVWGGVWKGVGMGREGRITHGNEETSGLDCDDSFTVMYICQNLSDFKL